MIHDKYPKTPTDFPASEAKIKVADTEKIYELWRHITVEEIYRKSMWGLKNYTTDGMPHDFAKRLGYELSEQGYGVDIVTDLEVTSDSLSEIEITW